MSRATRTSRRQFLKVSFAAGTASFLAACGNTPQVAVEPTAAPVPTVAPTVAVPVEPTIAPTVAPAVEVTMAPAVEATVAATTAPEATTTAAASAFQGTGGLTLPLATEPVTLRGFSTALYAPAPGISTLADQLFYQEAARRTNVAFEWQMAAADATNPIDLLMASGDLPDWFQGITPTEAVDYGQQGAIAPLNDLIDQHCPNLKRLMEQYPDIRGQLTAPDGNIYFFPRLLLDPQTRNFSGFMIRQDWLDEVSLPIPESTDDLYTVLKAFKDKDQNRYPLTFDPRPLAWAFEVGGRGAGQANDFYHTDAQAKYAPQQDAYREGLTYINKLYAEGLLDPEWATAQKQPEFLKERWLKGISGVQLGYAGSHLSPFATAMKTDVPEARLVPMLPPAGPSGFRDNLSVHNLIDAGTAGAISATSENKEALAKFTDYIYSPEGTLLYFWGLEGDTFEFDESGTPQYTDKVLKNELNLSVGEYVWNYISPDWFGPMYYPAVAYLQSVTPEAAAGLEMWAKLDSKQKLPVLQFTKEENSTIRTTMTDIDTLVEENIAKFIDGSASLDTYDAMVDQIVGIGIDDVTKVYQDAYDRFLAA